MIRKLAEYMGKDSEKSVEKSFHNSDVEPITALKEQVQPLTDSRLSLPITLKTFPTDGKDVRYLQLVEFDKYMEYKKILREEFEND